MKTNQTGFALLPVIAILVLTGVVGAGAYVVKSNNKANTASRESTEVENSSNLEPLPADLLSVDRVKAIAAGEVPNVEINSIELEREDGAILYKVKFVNGKILFYNAQTGAKVDRAAAKANIEDKNNIPANFTAAISIDKAREIAKAKKAGGTIKKIELETEDGIVVYSVRFTDGARIDVSAADGSIVRNDPAKAQGAPQNNAAGNSGSSNGASSSSGSTSGSSGSSNSGSGSSGSGSSGRNGSDDDSNDESSGRNRGSGSSGGDSTDD